MVFRELVKKLFARTPSGKLGIKAQAKLKEIADKRCSYPVSQYSSRASMESTKLFNLMVKSSSTKVTGYTFLRKHPCCSLRIHSSLNYAKYGQHCCERCYNDLDMGDGNVSKQRSSKPVPHGRKCEMLDYFTGKKIEPGSLGQ